MALQLVSANGLIQLSSPSLAFSTLFVPPRLPRLLVHSSRLHHPRSNLVLFTGPFICPLSHCKPYSLFALKHKYKHQRRSSYSPSIRTKCSKAKVNVAPHFSCSDCNLLTYQHGAQSAVGTPSSAHHPTLLCLCTPLLTCSIIGSQASTPNTMPLSNISMTHLKASHGSCGSLHSQPQSRSWRSSLAWSLALTNLSGHERLRQVQN